MERLNESGQWIVLMGILVSIGLFFLAFVINQSALVGQTTAEGVLEFPKNEIQDFRDEICRWEMLDPTSPSSSTDIGKIGLLRKNSVMYFRLNSTEQVGSTIVYRVDVYFHNGVTKYDEKRMWCS